MCATLRHRGPDDEGTYTARPVPDGSFRVGLGHRRLSIIDLDAGHQPMPNEDGTVQVVFNGEIYNHEELRKELSGRGHRFRTRCDTEAVVHAYEEWGERCPERLRGMFALAVWDEPQGKLMMARDPIGIKPLYYAASNGSLVFGSEMKAILASGQVSRAIDFASMDRFLAFEYITDERTIFSSVRRLRPGHLLVARGGDVRTRPYWKLSFETDRSRSYEETKEELLSILGECVRMRLMSDVPLGAFLSGGIDSSTIVALMSEAASEPVKTFSIGFKDSSYNELDYARMVAREFQTEHHELIIEPKAVELVDELIGFIDEPFADFSVFPTFLVSRMAREHVKVVLSGDGGDELFAGYPTYRADRLSLRYGKLPAWSRRAMRGCLDRVPPSSSKKGPANVLKRFVEGADLDPRLEHARWMVFLDARERDLLYSSSLKRELEGEDPLQWVRERLGSAGTTDRVDRQLYTDVTSYLTDDILVKVDRMSMANSLEARVPLLDHKFAEFVASIPSEWKLRGRSGKAVMRQAVAGKLPRAILTRPKQGFSIPIKSWLGQELKPLLLDTLSEETVKSRGYFSWHAVDRLVREHLEGRANHSHRLWALMVLESWHRMYVD